MFVLIADPDDRRAALFQQALARFGQPASKVVSWHDLAAGSVDLRECMRPGDIVRLDSPGRSFELYRAFLKLGAAAAEEEGSPFIEPDEIERLTFDKGRILFPRQWYLGFKVLLERVAAAIAACDDVRVTSDARDVATLFEKDRCQALLGERDVPVPAMLNPVPPAGAYDELIQRMRATGCRRAFIKLKHGSSASGVVAYETNGRREQARTTVQMETRGGEVALYNSRRLQRYTTRGEIAQLIDALATHGVHAEQWIPKASVRGRACDLRVLTIAGKPAHRVLRLGRGPMTNLHLLNDRCDADALCDCMPADAWDALLATCERAAAVFPRTCCVAFDVAVAVGYTRHFVLEANAFGDLLNDVTHNGLTPHEAQVRALLDRKGYEAQHASIGDAAVSTREPLAAIRTPLSPREGLGEGRACEIIDGR